MKKLLATIICCTLLVAGLAACSSSKDNNAAQNGQETKTPDTSSPKAEEVVTVKYVRPGTPPDDNAKLVQAINDKLAADKTNLQLEIQYIPSDVWMDKSTMMLSTGEEFDLMPVMEDQKGVSAYVAMDGLAPIGKYLDQYGSNIKKVVPEWMWESATMNGDIYTIPAYWTETANNNNNITIRRELLEKWGLKDPRTTDDLLNMAKVFTENWEGDGKPVVIPMFNEPFTWLFQTMDSYPFSVLKDLIYIDQQGNVKNWLETPEFKESAEFFRKLYEQGYVPQDILAKPNGWSWQQMTSGSFIWVDGMQLWGSEASWEERIPGVKLDTIYLNPDKPMFRETAFRNSTAVSSTSKHPEAAVKFLDWLYTSQENYDLVVYGVEGLTWEDKGTGLYTRPDPNFEFNADWMIGNLKFTRYEVGTYQKFIDILGTEKTEGVTNSVALNFVFDSTKVANEYANSMAEVQRSIYPIKLGIVSYEEGYEAALKKLKAAGIDKVIAEYQAQLNAHLGK